MQDILGSEPNCPLAEPRNRWKRQRNQLFRFSLSCVLFSGWMAHTKGICSKEVDVLFKRKDETRCMKKTANPERLVYNGTISLGLLVMFTRVLLWKFRYYASRHSYSGLSVVEQVTIYHYRDLYN